MLDVLWFIADMLRFIVGSIMVAIGSVVATIMLFSSENIFIRAIIIAGCIILGFYGREIMPDGYTIG